MASRKKDTTRVIAEELKPHGFIVAKADGCDVALQCAFSEIALGRLFLHITSRGSSICTVDGHADVYSEVIPRRIDDQFGSRFADLFDTHCISNFQYLAPIAFESDADEAPWYVEFADGQINSHNLDLLAMIVVDQVIPRWSVMSDIDSQFDFFISQADKDVPDIGYGTIGPLCCLLRGDVAEASRQCLIYWKPIRRRTTSPAHEPYKRFLAQMEVVAGVSLL